MSPLVALLFSSISAFSAETYRQEEATPCLCPTPPHPHRQLRQTNIPFGKLSNCQKRHRSEHVSHSIAMGT